MGKTEVRHMVKGDFAFARRLTDTMDWGLMEEDFSLMLELEPDGSFIAQDNGKRIGVVTTVSFGEIGWIGNFIVDQNHRSRGVGVQLITHAMKYLKEKYVTTIGLYAYENLVSFYENLGFRCSSRFVRLKGLGLISEFGETVAKKMKEEDIQKAMELDMSCAGMPRSRLLRRIFAEWSNHCYVAYRNEKLRGFIMARGTEIGPLICQIGFQNEALCLIRAVLNDFVGQLVYLGIPEEKKDIFDFLRKMGFTADFSVVRMYHGHNKEKMDGVLAMESLERG